MFKINEGYLLFIIYNLAKRMISTFTYSELEIWIKTPTICPCIINKKTCMECINRDILKTSIDMDCLGCQNALEFRLLNSIMPISLIKNIKNKIYK